MLKNRPGVTFYNKNTSTRESRGKHFCRRFFHKKNEERRRKMGKNVREKRELWENG
jgi:hypothetical protein